MAAAKMQNSPKVTNAAAKLRLLSGIAARDSRKVSLSHLVSQFSRGVINADLCQLVDKQGKRHRSPPSSENGRRWNCRPCGENLSAIRFTNIASPKTTLAVTSAGVTYGPYVRAEIGVGRSDWGDAW
jgi:hypothetical protein